MRFGRYGDYVIRSAYQPILRNDAGWLRPVAVEGLALVTRKGEPVPCTELFGAIPDGDKLFIECMCRALHILNCKPSGINHLDLFFNFDPSSHLKLGQSIHEIRYTARHTGDLGVSTRMLVCEITEAAAPDNDILLELVRETRRHGIRIAIDDFGAGQSDWERCDLLQPDLVKIDAGWFQRLVAERSALHLLARLIEQFSEREIPVLIEGIETPLHLRAALDAGAELFQGYLFGRPALAGSGFSDKPIPLASVEDNTPPFSILQARQQRQMFY